MSSKCGKISVGISSTDDSFNTAKILSAPPYESKITYLFYYTEDVWNTVSRIMLIKNKSKIKRILWWNKKSVN
jgi:hypothetical protein